MKFWFLAVIALFSVCLSLGLLLPPPETLIADTLGGYASLFEMLADLPPFALALFILVNNAITLIVSFGFAPLFGLVPIFVVGFNGWLIGVVVAGIIQTESVGYAVRGLLPHGIIEIPAFLFAEAVALSFAATLLTSLFVPEKRPQLFHSFVRHLKMLGIAAALLIPAAFIEVFVTARLIGA